MMCAKYLARLRSSQSASEALPRSQMQESGSVCRHQALEATLKWLCLGLSAVCEFGVYYHVIKQDLLHGDYYQNTQI
jgi:hypothetical protein